MMRNLGHLLLWIGVLGGAFVAVRDPDHVVWWIYGVLAAVALVGVVLLRRTTAARLSDGDRIGRRLDGLRAALVQADDRLRALHAASDEIDVYAVHERLDAELAEPLATFADGREAMIPAFGLTTYGEVMTRFAAAERLVNRVWSASADGYVDEVRTCLAQASDLLGQARAALDAAARGRDASASASPDRGSQV